MHGYLAAFDYSTGKAVHPLMALPLQASTASIVRPVVAFHVPFHNNRLVVGEYPSTAAFVPSFYELPDREKSRALLKLGRGLKDADALCLRKAKAAPTFESIKIRAKDLRSNAAQLDSGKWRADALHYSGDRVYALLGNAQTTSAWNAHSGKLISNQSTQHEIPFIVNPVISGDGGIAAVNVIESIDNNAQTRTPKKQKLAAPETPKKTPLVLSFEYHVENKLVEEDDDDDDNDDDDDDDEDGDGDKPNRKKPKEKGREKTADDRSKREAKRESSSKKK